MVPTIRIEPRPLDDEVAAVLRELAAYRLVVFTSTNAVRVFAGYLARGTEDGGMPPGPVVAAVRPGHRRGAREARPRLPRGAGRVRRRRACRRARGDGGRRRRRPRAHPVARPSARDVLPETLRARGAVVDVLPVYDTVAVEELAEPAARVEAADYITFTSAQHGAGGSPACWTRRPTARGARRPAPLAERLVRRPPLLHRPGHQRGAARAGAAGGRGGPGVHGRGPRRGDRGGRPLALRRLTGRGRV